MKKFRKVLDGLTTSSPGGTMGSPSSGSAAGTPTAAPTPKEIDIQETLVSENFQMCKGLITARNRGYSNSHPVFININPRGHVCTLGEAGMCVQCWLLPTIRLQHAA
ncbi:hypothetical protein JOQ06_029946 [Pogonophryne albipinna]|uniref:Uncharacterized protein n=1 Tax=Pogonophryne albipinna TaxID=1090488 RepID=A0AAD6AW26_9TELE|nr:hypothetical protein JOQ06_029946 [Pogonophryne albipinna]